MLLTFCALRREKKGFAGIFRFLRSVQIKLWGFRSLRRAFSAYPLLQKPKQRGEFCEGDAQTIHN